MAVTALRVPWHAPQGLHLTDYGAVGDGVTVNTDAITAWALDCVAKRLPGYVPTGTFMTHTVNIQCLGDLHIYGAPGAIIKGIAGDGVVLNFDGWTTRPRFTMRNITVDNSLRGFVVAAASGTALGLVRWANYDIRNCRFVSTLDYRDQKGDAGFSCTFCGSGIIDGCYFQGQPDGGIYNSGGGSVGHEDDYGEQTVVNCVFYRCAGGASFKRQMRRSSVMNCRVIECATGFGNVEANRPPPFGTGLLPPAPEFIVTGCFFKKIESRAIWAKEGPVIFANNIIEDWGHDISGVYMANQYAVMWHAKDGLCVNNVFRFVDWPLDTPGFGTNQTAIRVVCDIDLDDTMAWTPTDNLIDGNIIKDCTYGINETGNPDPAKRPNRNYGRNRFVNVPTPITILDNQGLSLSRYEVIGA